jgi:hypothetical protein
MGTKRNPDILMPEGSFLQGRKYKKETFLKHETGQSPDIGAAKTSLPNENDSSDEEGEIVKIDEFQKMKNQAARYYTTENCTIRCFNCKEPGHLARECPNQKKGELCLLCGKTGHNSFDCHEKLCFKCNKSGHEIRDCQAEAVDKCGKCDMLGHKEARCLKIWNNDKQGDTYLKYARCIECGKYGHLKCTREKESDRMEIEFRAPTNFDDFQDFSDDEKFVKNMLKSEALASRMKNPKKKSKMLKLSNMNIKMGEDEEGYYSSDYGLPRKHNEDSLYCCICSQQHRDADCPEFYNRRTGIHQKYS